MQQAAARTPLNSKSETSSTQVRRRECWSAFITNHYAWAVLFLALLLFLPLLGDRDFWAPVEPRYGEIVRTMFA